MLQKKRPPQQKDPVAMVLIIVGVLVIFAICVGVEQLIPRY